MPPEMKKYSSNNFYNQVEGADPVERRSYEATAKDEDPGVWAEEVEMNEPAYKPDVWSDPELVPPPVLYPEDDEEGNGDFHIQNETPYEGAEGLSRFDDGTLDNLDAFSPPTGDNFNIAELDPENSNLGEGVHMSQQYVPKLNLDPSEIDESDRAGRSLSKKEKDMLEIAQLIQKANDTTNHLLENSDNFRFKVRGGEPSSAAKHSPHQANVQEEGN